MFMAQEKVVATLGKVDEMWGAALKERGFRCVAAKTVDEAVKTSPDFVLVDIRDPKAKESLGSLRNSFKGSILSLIEESTSRSELVEMKEGGAQGYISIGTPPQELAIRMSSMLRLGPEQADVRSGEARSAKRVWFQQKVNFQIFNEQHEAWSTTLSETGIFLRTSLSFPLYSVMKMEFHLWGDPQPFQCDGVIVRQEVEAEIRGLGVMFQNLKGEGIRRLESFLDIYR